MKNLLKLDTQGTPLKNYKAYCLEDYVATFGFDACMEFQGFRNNHPDRPAYRARFVEWRMSTGFGTFSYTDEIYMVLDGQTVSMLHIGQPEAWPGKHWYVTQWPTKEYVGKLEYRESIQLLKDYIFKNNFADELVQVVAITETSVKGNVEILVTFCRSGYRLNDSDDHEIVSCPSGKIAVFKFKKETYTKDKYITILETLKK